ncbi:MAG: succinyl-diaminopimelate desuccinylase [Actinomycetes bacterium]
MSQLLGDALALVSVDSPSRGEAELVSLLEGWLADFPDISVQRVGDNLIAEANLERSERVLLVGHLDTVPISLGHAPRIEGDLLYGVGSADMKGSLAVFLGILKDAQAAKVGISLVLYAREEIARSESGLTEVLSARPDLTSAKIAIVGEPTAGAIEAGCQGSLRTRIDLAGLRAHSARPFMGRNAIHRSAALVAAVGAYEPREVEIEGLGFTEQVQCVGIDGGISGNVVPDRCSLSVNFRYAPNRTPAQAEQWIREFFKAYLEPGDYLEFEDNAPAAQPFLSLAAVAQLLALTGKPAHAKVGWTDVATLADAGLAAVNFGAGDPLLAHHPDEQVSLAQLESMDAVLRSFLGLS